MSRPHCYREIITYCPDGVTDQLKRAITRGSNQFGLKAKVRK